MPPERSVRVGLVGTGRELATAIGALVALPALEILVVSDTNDASQGAALARRLQIPLVKDSVEIFRPMVDIVLEVSGDARQYERLLSTRPAGVDVVGMRGTRLLGLLLQQGQEVRAEGSEDTRLGAEIVGPVLGIATDPPPVRAVEEQGGYPDRVSATQDEPAPARAAGAGDRRFHGVGRGWGAHLGLLCARVLILAPAVTVVALSVGLFLTVWPRHEPADRPTLSERRLAPDERHARDAEVRSQEPVAAGVATGPQSAARDTAPKGLAPPDHAPETAEAGALGGRPTNPVSSERAAVFRVQIGTFLDARNAERLVERLRGETLPVLSRVIESRKALYRVRALSPEAEGPEYPLQPLRAAGLAQEEMSGSPGITEPARLAAAVETARRLRHQGIVVRVERAVSSTVFHVVRVGAFGTVAEADRAQVELAARGLEGFVVREQ